MASFNRVILLGNLTRDIEVRYLQSGMAVADIGMAVNDRRKNQTGEWIEETTFVDVTLWGRTAEIAGEYLGKGSPLLIEGRLKYDTWEKDGQKRSKLTVVCERMQMIGGRGGPGAGGAGGGPGSGGARGSRGGGQNQNNYDDGGGDYGYVPSAPPRGATSRSTAPSAPPPPTGDEIPF
jgi:single-strand DNA-binding protein